MQRFLIIQTAFLGDVILATPVVSELHRIYPDAQIDMLVRKGNEGILENHPAIDNVYTLNKKEGKLREIKRLVKLFKEQQYDEIFNLHRFGSSGIITFLTKAKSKTGFDKNPFSFCYDKKIKHVIGDGTHETERNLSLIASHGAERKARPSLFPGEQEFAVVANLTHKPFYCLAPASVWSTKQLPEAKWVELAKQLSQKAQVYLVGAPGDFDLCERIRKNAGLNESSNIAGKLALLESCALFSKSLRCYVNDSGPMHMASAVNAPTTAFYCSTIPAFGFGPLADDSIVAEIDEILYCRPCGLHGYKKCPEGHFKCGDISIEKHL